MQAGALKDRIRFERRGVDDNGDRLGDWNPDEAVTRWARLIFLQGGEGVLQQRLAGQQPVVITIREDGETKLIDNTWRGVDTLTGKTFDIREAHPAKGERAAIDLLAVEVQGDAE
jgi:head-tail adaptor